MIVLEKNREIEGNLPLELPETTEMASPQYIKTLEQTLKDLKEAGIDIILLIERGFAYSIDLSYVDGKFAVTYKRLSEDDLRRLVSEKLAVHKKTHALSIAAFSLVGSLFISIAPFAKPINLAIMQNVWNNGLSHAVTAVGRRYETEDQALITSNEFERSIAEANKSKHMNEQREISQKDQEAQNKLASIMANHMETMKTISMG